MNKIGIVGAGTMGNGIAHVSALSGFDTILMDIKDEYVDFVSAMSLEKLAFS